MEIAKQKNVMETTVSFLILANGISAFKPPFQITAAAGLDNIFHSSYRCTNNVKSQSETCTIIS